MRRWPAIAAALGLAHAATAFVLFKNEDDQPLRWRLDDLDPFVHPNVVNRDTRAIRYYLARDAWSAKNAAAELDAIRAAIGQWQSVPGTILKFEEGGLVPPGVDVNGEDNTNVVYWVKKAAGNGAVWVNNERTEISGALAVTFPMYFDDHTIVEADMVFNGVDRRWFVDYNNSFSADNFVEAVALHEFGHFIGLQHSPLGAATMFSRTGAGVGLAVGLVKDEIAATQALYGEPAALARLGSITGKVTMGRGLVFGAVVLAEDAHGNIIQSTVTERNGRYELMALPPATYRLRVAPLHSPDTQPQPLVRDIDISIEREGAETNFRPTGYKQTAVGVGKTAALDFAVNNGKAQFYISAVRPPTTKQNLLELAFEPIAIGRTGKKQMIGVYSPTLPTSGATLRLTGDGVVYGKTTYSPNAFDGFNMISVEVTVAKNAAPGVRSLFVQKGNDKAYLNGFAEILSGEEDHNFDGLDDRWQREQFAVFSSAEAHADADADADGYTNREEYVTGKNPTDAGSFPLLEIGSITVDEQGTTIQWGSVPGKRYQVWRKPDASLAKWRKTGASVTAQRSFTFFTDPSERKAFQFYRVQALP
ncbi:MAG: matrixin family metalloprotease [Verrucomicrobiia bacterium]